MRKKKIFEWAKTALIVLLVASALLMGRQIKLFSDFFGSIPLFGGVADLVRGASGTGSGGASGGTFKEAARPLAIVISNSDGERYGVQYDADARNAAYDRTSSILVEALGSASEAVEISEDEWRGSLMGAGVYFEYAVPVKLSVLGGWLGAKLPDAMGDESLRRIFVAFGDDMSRLFYQNSENSLFYVADTAASSSKAQELDVFSANGAVFAFELGIGVAENAPYVIILPSTDFADIRASAAASDDELLDLVQNAMGHQNEIYTPYRDGAGALIRVGAQFRMQIDTMGRVVYRRTDTLVQGGAGRNYGEGEIIEMARVIVAETIGDACGSAEVFFESFSYGEGGIQTVYFGYYFGGGHISLYEDGYAAKISFVDGAAVEVELIFREYLQMDEYTRLLPVVQALAAAGQEFVLSYLDSGASMLQPAWVKG
ncbi:MAG: hypothetical protein FWH33_07725 [Oscillospiraceae bacterium]|nr:hypothetical protein [Oscillospiraceae bacterium]